MDKRFWGFLAVAAVVLGAIFFITSSKNGSSAGSANAQPTNHVTGSTSTGVKLVEYGDFQCPACGSYYPLVKQIEEKYKDQIQVQFRNFPLYQIHQNAMAGARAAEAADLQGKYWQMNERLFSENGLYYQAQQQGKNYPTWISSSSPLAEFAAYAKEFGMNVDKFKTDYASSEVNGRIQADLKKGNSLKIQSTPTFFLDDKKITNPNNLDEFSKLIDQEIKNKTGKAPAATAPASTDSTGSGGNPGGSSDGSNGQ